MPKENQDKLSKDWEKELRQQLYFILKEAYDLRKSTPNFSDQESEFNLPCIDMELVPKVLKLFAQILADKEKELSKYWLEIVKIKEENIGELLKQLKEERQEIKRNK